jgi:hypothetical protein
MDDDLLLGVGFTVLSIFLRAGRVSLYWPFEEPAGPGLCAAQKS